MDSWQPLYPPGDRRWKDAIQATRDQLEASIGSISPPVPQVPKDLQKNVAGIPAKLLDPAEVAITEKPAEELLKLLASGQLTAVEVTRAFLRRAALAQRLVNCLTGIMPDSALKRAEELDQYFAKHKRPIGPLHGLPISLKEHLNLKDWEVTWSFVSWIGKLAPSSGELLLALQNAGAIFYARTTQPQMLLHLETSNNINGVTVNPFNTDLTCGGSSGGEGALLGLGGSALGVGSDVGGSIRIPAGHNGVYGFKPTSSRLSLKGFTGIVGGRHEIPSVVGPMSTSLASVERFMEVAVGAELWKIDPSMPPVPWRNEVDWLKKSNGQRKLRVAVLWDDGIVKPLPPVTRALREVVEKLEKFDDVEVVDWKPYDHELGFQIWSRCLFADNGSAMKAVLALSGEELRPLSKWVLEENPLVEDRSRDELWSWIAKRDMYRAEYARLFQETGKDDPDRAIDVILSPIYPAPPPLLGKSKYWHYGLVWNVLDWPGITFPVTKVIPELDGKDTSYKPRNERDQRNQDLYDDPEAFRDAPISLQLLGQRWGDEKVLQALRFIEERIGAANVRR